MTENQALPNHNVGFLWKLLANPADGLPADIHALEALVDSYPQSGLLEALYACIGDRKNFKRASVYFNTKSLYKLLNNPESFENVTVDKVFISKELLGNHLFADKSNTTDADILTEAESHQAAENIEVDLLGLAEPENIAIANTAPELDVNAYQESIIEEDIIAYRTSEEIGEPGGNDLTAHELLVEENTTSKETEKEELVVKENLIVEEPIAPMEASTIDGQKEEATITKYDDDTLPYTFLWWLNKLRKEHKQNYRPYANTEAVFHYKFKRVKKPADDLQFQYIENIFHINAVSDLEKHTADKPAVAPPVNKEHEIIERFIKEEPQIRPMQIDKIDGENKAKKSSEERESFVTETLAKIYSEQGLHDKAVAAYQKLILKFPEKTRYFADKIEQLQKKTDL
jgi:hypothetical protein